MAEKKTKKIERIIKDWQFLHDFAPKEEWSELINVFDLIAAIKDKNNSKKISNVLENPGCYKWWAKKEDVEELLRKKLSVNENLKKLFSETESSRIFETKENLYCIYVGKANCLYDRLKIHATTTETSTLRKTICSLTCNQNDSLTTIDNEIDKWLSNFKVQYFPLLKSKRIEEKRKRKRGKGEMTFYKLNDDLSLLDLEYFFINEYFHILNVDVNHYVEYTKKKGSLLSSEATQAIEKIKDALSEKKKKWPKEKITEKKKKKG